MSHGRTIYTLRDFVWATVWDDDYIFCLTKNDEICQIEIETGRQVYKINKTTNDEEEVEGEETGTRNTVKILQKKYQECSSNLKFTLFRI
eukprot:UN31577